MNENLLYLIIIVLLGNIVEAITGFGSTIIAVTLGAYFYSMEEIIVSLVPLNILLSLYLAGRYRKEIEYSILLKKIFPLTFVGLGGGILIFNLVQSNVLKLIYGIFVVLLSGVQLIRLLILKNKTSSFLSPIKSIFFLLFGGIMQGAYASGGPLVVYYANTQLVDKKSFRATLSALWLILNIFLIASYIAVGKITPTTLNLTLAFLPSLFLGILLGEWLHRIIPEKKFRIFVFILLMIAGTSLIIKG